MGWFSALLGRREKAISAIQSVESSIKLSFIKVREDIARIGLWIRYFSEETLRNEAEHNSINSEIIRQRSEIEMLKINQERIVSAFEKNTEIISNLTSKIEKMDLEIAKEKEKTVEKTQGTSKGTSQGHLRDMSLLRKKYEKAQKDSIIPKEIMEKAIIEDMKPFLNKNILTASELEILKVLYYYERPLSYNEISKIVGKKEKSIRNLIYELRKRGIEILDKPIGIREKGFYLSGNAKIMISGR